MHKTFCSPWCVNKTLCVYMCVCFFVFLVCLGYVSWAFKFWKIAINCLIKESYAYLCVIIVISLKGIEGFFFYLTSNIKCYAFAVQHVCVNVRSVTHLWNNIKMTVYVCIVEQFNKDSVKFINLYDIQYIYIHILPKSNNFG